MTTSKRFSGLMGEPEPSIKAPEPQPTDDAPEPTKTSKTPASSVTQPTAPATPAPESKTKAKVQLNTQQPEDLKNAADKAAAYLTFTTGKKVTTTDFVEQALRKALKDLPPGVIDEIDD